MAIYCPHCATPCNIRFAIGPAGRMVRCEQCGTTWLARVVDEDPYHGPAPRGALARSPEVSDAIVIEHVGAGFRTPPPRPGRARSRIPVERSGLKVLGAVLGVIVAIMVLRVPFVAALPQFATMAGLPNDVGQLEFENVRSETVDRHGVSTLFVEGEIVNRSGRDVVLPAVRISLTASDGAEVQSWLVEPSTSGLAAGQSIGFRSALASPPSAASQVTLNLAAREGQTIGLH